MKKLIGLILAMLLASPALSHNATPSARVPSALLELGDWYRDICESVGGNYYADEQLLRQTDVQYWRCEGGDWCGTYPNLPSCKPAVSP